MSTMIVFGTCTRPAYYDDVHKLLALPSGSILRYDYSERHFSAGALQHLTEAKNPTVLLFYIQADDFKKGGDDPVGLLDPQHSLVVPTRLARVVTKFRILKDGRWRHLFDLELGGYPRHDEVVCQRLMIDLHALGDIPFQKWIALSEDEEALARFGHGDEAGWGPLVDAVGSPPSQFSGDTFWRIRRVSAKSTRTTIQPTVNLQEATDADPPAAVYVLSERRRYRIEVESHIPIGETARQQENRYVTVETSDPEVLVPADERKLIRRNSADRFDLTVKSIDDLAGHLGTVRLITQRTEGDESLKAFPQGPDLELNVKVEKSHYAMVGAGVLGIAGVVMFAIGAGVVEDHLSTGIVLIF